MKKTLICAIALSLILSLVIKNAVYAASGITLSKESGDYAKSHSVQIIDSDWTNLQTVWSTSKTFPTTGFTSQKVKSILYTPVETGNYYLHIKGTLNGKEQRYTSGVFKVDNTAPQLTITPSTTNWTREVTLVATGQDAHSGIDKVYLKSNENDKNILSMNEILYWGGSNFEKVNFSIRFASNSAFRGGIYIPQQKFKKNENYVLSFNIRKLSGNIPYIGGHLHIASESEVYIDGKRVTSSYTYGEEDINDWSKRVDYPNDNKTHEVVVKFKTDKYDEVSDKTVYIQINRGAYNYDYSVEISNIQLEVGNEKTPYEPNSADLVEPSNPFTVNVTENGDYTFVAVDKAGNSTERSIKVSNIDREAPLLQITPNTTEKTHDDVIVTVNAQDTGGSGVKRIKTPNGIWINGNQVVYTVKENGTFTFVVEDHAGNQTSKTITINNIDKSISFEKPTIYSFDDVTLSDQRTVFTTDITPIIIEDWRDEENHWKLHVFASPLKRINDNYSLPNGSVRIQPFSQITRIEGNGVLPNQKITSSQVIDNGTVDLLEASNSRGKYQAAFPTGALEIVIDPTTAKPGTYQTTITWELVFAP